MFSITIVQTHKFLKSDVNDDVDDVDNGDDVDGGVDGGNNDCDGDDGNVAVDGDYVLNCIVFLYRCIVVESLMTLMMTLMMTKIMTMIGHLQVAFTT